MNDEQNFKIALIKISVENLGKAAENVLINELFNLTKKIFDDLPENLRNELKKIAKEKLKENGYKL